MSKETMIERVARAISALSGRNTYGLYDYSKYPGDAPPHVVRDELTGKEVFRSNSSAEAAAVHVRLLGERVARAAIEAMREPTPGMEAAGRDVLLPYFPNGRAGKLVAHQWEPSNAVYRNMINAALKDEQR